MPLTRKTVMISSTARDLPKHREEVMNACLSQGMFPVMMEHLPANDDDAISASLKMVDDADIYVGVYAQRYGYIPKGKKRNPKQISITEMEYDRAVKRGIPRLTFVMDKAHPITIEDIDMENAAKLQKFKDRVQAKNIVNFFKSPAELRAQVLNSLSKYFETTPITLPEKETSSIDVTVYFNALRKRYNVLALEGLTPPQKEEYLQIQLRSVFVEQSVREDTPPVELPKEVWEKLSREQEIHAEDLPSGITLDDVRKARESYYQKPSQLVLDALTDSKNKYAIVLGDPGSGKSTLARYIMLSLIDPSLAGDKIQKTFEGHLPLLIELRTFIGACAENKCETPLEFLEHLGKTEGWGLTQSALQSHLKGDGRAVVIFDGLDEIFEPKLRETITNQIVGFTNTYPKARVIVTSRILGYRRKILSDAGFTHFTLQDLNEDQVQAFITKWYDLAMSDRPDEAKERSERILKSFADSASIHQLAGNPMLLTIMAIIGKHQELPRERWKLYDHAASVLIQHWDVNKHLKDERIEADFIGEDDKKELLRRLAFRMQSGDGGLAGNYMHRADLQEEFENYLEERYSQTPDRAKVIAEAMIQQFRERNFILSLYGANVFGFVHRAFLEYFCASAFVWKFEKTKELTIEELKSDVYGKHWEDQSWHEVLRLICGMVDEKWVGNIIDFLLNQKSQQAHISLALRCFNEVRNTISLEKQAEILIQNVFSMFDDFLSRSSAGSAQRGFLEKEVIPFVSQVAMGCNASNLTIEWLRTRKTFKWWQYYSEPLADLICLVSARSNTMHDILLRFLQQEDERRILALFSLVKCWKDSDVSIEMLDKYATSDPSRDVRSASINIIAKYYSNDSRSLEILMRSAVNDPSRTVRADAISEIAEHFVNDSQSADLLRHRAVEDSKQWVRGRAIQSIIQHFADAPWTLPLLLDRLVNDVDDLPDDRYGSLSVRQIALEALLKLLHDEIQLRQILTDRVKNDPNMEVRSYALTEMARCYQNHPETLLMLHNGASKHQHAELREAAISALATYYRDDIQTLPFLLECVTQNDEIARRAAMSALAEYYNKDAQVLPIMQDHAIKDESDDVRRVAVSAIIEHYREDAETLSLLRERAVNDESPKPDDEDYGFEYHVRQTAITAIAKYWSDHPDTLGLLRERAEHDPTPWLRERCKELIKEIEGKK